MRKTIQGIIYPNREIRKILETISHGCQKVYNHFIGERKKYDKNKQKQPSKYEQKRQLKEFKDANPKLKSIQSQILQEVVRVKVPNAWQKYQEHKRINSQAKYPRTKTGKGWYSGFSYPQPIVNGVWVFKIENNNLIIKQGSAVKKSERELKIPLKLNQPIQGEIKTLTISWKNWDKMLVSFTCEIKEKPKMPLSEVEEARGGDRGSINLVADNKGWKVPNPKYWKKEEELITELKRALSKKQQPRFKGDKVKFSKNHGKAKRKLVKECQRLTNRVKDRNHKLTRRIIDKFDLIIYEDLKLKKMVEKKNAKGKKRKISKYTAKGLQEVSLFQITNFTIYKAKEAGKWVYFVNPMNTSKRCFGCGTINKELDKERWFACVNPNCDYENDRDVNAAKNILYRGITELGTGNGRLSPLLLERV
ncbi:MAG: transposase IS605 [Mycoplasmataceae bacterium RC_NB112A]|nr:MAG: transposase IS605 [Mycoplasmataceae bacterium RC_NB112A]